MVTNIFRYRQADRQTFLLCFTVCISITILSPCTNLVLDLHKMIKNIWTFKQLKIAVLVLYLLSPKNCKLRWIFPVWLQNWLLSAGLYPADYHTEKSCIVSYYRHFFTIIKIKLVLILKFSFYYPRKTVYNTMQ